MNAAEGHKKFEQLASWLAKEHPNAAGSPRERLAEFFTIGGTRLSSKLKRGSPGWLRSSAWIELFSSKLKTTALSGGSMYSRTTSSGFSSKQGSVLTLKVRHRCRFSSADLHVRLTKLADVPAASAIDRDD